MVQRLRQEFKRNDEQRDEVYKKLNVTNKRKCKQVEKASDKISKGPIDLIVPTKHHIAS